MAYTNQVFSNSISGIDYKTASPEIQSAIDAYRNLKCKHTFIGGIKERIFHGRLQS